mgnify:CR=1 FL=1
MADIKKELNAIKNAVYGREVRSSIHDGIKKINEESEGSRQIANNTKQRQDAVEQQFNTLLSEWSDDKPIDNAETIAARTNTKESKTYENLGKRLDEEYEKVTTQLEKIEEEMFKSSLVLHKRTRPMFVWHDDDGHKGVYTKLAPLLREYGIVMSVSVITNRPHGFPIEGLPAYDPNSQYMSYEQMKELENEGLVEFIPHAHTNRRLTDMTIEELHEELSTCQNIMRQLGWNYRDLVYPFGAYNDTVISVARQYFRSAFKVGGGPLLTPFNQFAINRIRVDAPATFEEIKEDIDKAFENNTLGVLTTHVDQYGGLDLQKMRQVIEYILSNGGEFVTTAEAINEFGNVLQVGTNSIGFDGKIYGRELGVYREGYLDYPPNAPITDFQKGTVTRLKVRRADMEHYNLLRDPRRQGSYGIIETHRDETEDAFSFQIFTDIENKWSLIRHWDDGNNEWGTWVDFDNLNYMKREVTNAPPSHYPTYKTTIEKVQSNVASDYGLKSAGLLVTQKDNEYVYTHQIFFPIASGLTFSEGGIAIRHATSDSTWGDWFYIPTRVNAYFRKWNNITIPAQSSIDRVTTASSATVNSIYVNRVKSPLPPGINIQSYCWENGTLITRITNSTASPITIDELEVDILKIMA